MRVAIAHDWLINRRGAERVLRELCLGFEDVSIHTLFARRERIDDAIARRPIATTFLDRLPGIPHYYRYLLPLFSRAVETLRVDDADVLVSISHLVAKGVPHDPAIPHVCYLLTPARCLWYPELYPAGMSPCRGAYPEPLARRLREWDLRSNEGVDRFVAISRTVQERVHHLYGRPCDVIYPCIDLDFFHPSGEDRDDFYLTVSALVPQKRLEVAVEAFNRLGKRLVVVGDGPLATRLAAAAGPGVSFPGWIPDDRLRDLYRRARALVFPGFDEFGLVPVEAQACGCPVIAWNRGGASETVIDGRTGILYEEPTAGCLADAVRRFEDEGGAEATACRRSAERFSRERFLSDWDRCLQDIGVTAPEPALLPAAV